MFVRQTIAGAYAAWYGSCFLFGFFDVDFISEGAFHSSTFIFDPHLTSDSATSNLTPFPIRALLSHSNEPTSYTHTHEMSAHALLAMYNPGVVEAFFEGIRAMLDGSGHTGVDGEHVGMVDGDSASGDAHLASVHDANIGRKND
ncbi:hypothetical protein K443DRAFT_11196 [Laccaria amethystina LaAM-08-1]|uniref:Uncharacterized protein n=1 Tax=Laccaria amethystina LaAM-08-1 TaxID=1095629 RepID=A0A0C9X342_9AGAR|nr:hypothetical protein K443DRAFT_11196 [Laccaria amethystina LaAM-08-1]